ncbi:hypothetical protein DFP72DRAFT_1051800, partial [Ephemerocybe angulata]
MRRTTAIVLLFALGTFALSAASPTPSFEGSGSSTHKAASSPQSPEGVPTPISSAGTVGGRLATLAVRFGITEWGKLEMGGSAARLADVRPYYRRSRTWHPSHIVRAPGVADLTIEKREGYVEVSLKAPPREAYDAKSDIIECQNLYGIKMIYNGLYISTTKKYHAPMGYKLGNARVGYYGDLAYPGQENHLIQTIRRVGGGFCLKLASDLPSIKLSKVLTVTPGLTLAEAVFYFRGKFIGSGNEHWVMEATLSSLSQSSRTLRKIDDTSLKRTISELIFDVDENCDDLDEVDGDEDGRESGGDIRLGDGGFPDRDQGLEKEEMGATYIRGKGQSVVGEELHAVLYYILDQDTQRRRPNHRETMNSFASVFFAKMKPLSQDKSLIFPWGADSVPVEWSFDWHEGSPSKAPTGGLGRQAIVIARSQ